MGKSREVVYRRFLEKSLAMLLKQRAAYANRRDVTTEVGSHDGWYLNNFQFALLFRMC